MLVSEPIGVLCVHHMHILAVWKEASQSIALNMRFLRNELSSSELERLLSHSAEATAPCQDFASPLSERIAKAAFRGPSQLTSFCAPCSSCFMMFHYFFLQPFLLICHRFAVFIIVNPKPFSTQPLDETSTLISKPQPRGNSIP